MKEYAILLSRVASVFAVVSGVKSLEVDTSVRANYDDIDLHDPLPQAAILIIGAGHFGKRAARILRQKSDAPIFVIDKDKQSLIGLQEDSVEKIFSDGVEFLVRQFRYLSSKNMIIPALPRHLASEWLKGYLHKELRIRQTQVPEEVRSFLPHTWRTNEGSLLISYADFRCPEDCPEPGPYCTVTGERRGLPLYQRLSQLTFLDFRVHIIRSHQLAPGLGGYKAGDLAKLAHRLVQEGPGRWFVGTACKCHGTLTAIEVSGK